MAQTPLNRIVLAGVAAAALAATSGLAHAADAQGRFAVKSVGAAKCSAFVEAINSKNTAQISVYMGWIAGYVSASNQLEPDTFDLAAWQDTRTLLRFLHRHCDRNADVRFGLAAAQLVSAMKPDKITEQSELISFEHDGRTFPLYTETLRRAQAALAQLGMYTGELDGTLNDATREGITSFQRENKVPETGVPDQATLWVLFSLARKAADTN